MGQGTQGSALIKKERIVGRVLADIHGSLGAGVGPLWSQFIFGVEPHSNGKQVRPVLIAYLFYNFHSEGLLPDNFYDYTKVYELEVFREPKCDQSVESLSWVKNIDESGRPLPPTYALSFLKGAPKDVVKSDSVLPCYTLRPNDYRIHR